MKCQSNRICQVEEGAEVVGACKGLHVVKGQDLVPLDLDMRRNLKNLAMKRRSLILAMRDLMQIEEGLGAGE